ncbi:MAG: long-chain fatty acid--CoA ligase [Candidatus Eremiobacterota bacterium]
MADTVISEFAPPQALLEWAKNAEIKTLAELFRRTVKKCGPRNFLGWKEQGSYRYLTFNQVQERVHQFASALIELGIKQGDRTAQIANNRPEWVITDQGIFHAGGIHAPLYPTLNEEGIQYILNDCGARIVVVAFPDQLQKVVSVESTLSGLEHIVCMFKPEVTSSKKLWTWDDFLKLGADNLSKNMAEIDRRIAETKPEDVCSLVYTSGTTGEPKGAMLMHGNFCSNVTSTLPLTGIGSDDIELSFLPLSHVFERIIYYSMTYAGGTVAYAESIDTVRDDLLIVQPTVVPSVPRLFEKIMGRVLDQVAASPPLRQKIFHWALGVGKKYFDARVSGNIPLPLKLQHKLAHKLVFKKIHARTGGRIRYFVSGGAPLRRDVGEFFLNAGFIILEGYGLTETSPVITMNPPSRPKIGTVGKTIPHVEVQIAADGEILSRGPHIMRGYFNKLEATREVINEEGWFHTGDVGVFDEDGYLRITDRKKEILVMSNGKNVAPQPIENLLKSSPFVEQAVLIGDNKNFISALIFPNFDQLKAAGVCSDPSQMAKDPKVTEFLTQEAVKLCGELSNYERVKKVAVLPYELTQDTGELTPTMKVKRRVVNEKFKDLIDGMYAEAPPA